MEAMVAMFASGAGAGLGGTALAITGPELFFGTAASAAAAAGGGVTLTGLATTGSILSGAFDTLSMVGDVLGTVSQIGQANQTAADKDLQALTIRNQQGLDEIKALEELRARIGTQIANSFAGGLAATGSVETAINESIEQQEFETRVGGRDARIRSMQLELEADSARSSTTSILFSGLSTAAGRAFGSNQRNVRRG